MFRPRLALFAIACLGAACGGSTQKSAEAPGDGSGESTGAAGASDQTLSDVLAARAKAGAEPSITQPPADEHEAALRALLGAPWGARNDKDDQVHAPTPDWEHWRRVRFWGFEHFTGFKYGKDHHVIAAVFVQDVPAGTPVKSETCMRRFEAWGRPQIKSFDVKFGPFNVKWGRWRDQPLMVTYVDGQLNYGLSRVEFSGAWAAYPAYPNACLIYAVGVPWRGHGELAKKLRDRWVDEGFAFMDPLTPERPFRK